MNTIAETMQAMQAVVDGAEGRSLTDDEITQYEQHEETLQSLRRDQEVRGRQQAYATPADDAHVVMGSGEGSETRADDELLELVTARTTGRVQYRAATTSNAGARVGTAARDDPNSPYIWRVGGFRPLDGDTSGTFEGPYFAPFTAVSPTAEGDTKPNLADPSLTSAAMEAYSLTLPVSDQVTRFGVGLGPFSRRLQNGVIYSINAATATAAETEAGTPLTFAESAAHMVDLGIATAADQTGEMPTLVLVNPADYPLLSQKTPANASDIGSRFAQWNGCTVVPNSQITAGVGVVVVGGLWAAASSGMLVATQPELSTNTVLARAESYFATFAFAQGSAVGVELASAA